MNKFSFSTFLIFFVFILNLQGQTGADSSKPAPAALQRDSNLVIFHSFFETNDVSPIRLERALVFGYKALDYARKFGTTIQVDSIQQGLEYCYFFISADAARHFDYLTAYKYSERRLNLKDSMFQQERSAEISELKSASESDKKKLEVQLAGMQKELVSMAHTMAAQEERESRNLMISLSVSAFLLIVLFLLLPNYILGRAVSSARKLKPTASDLIKDAVSDKSVLPEPELIKESTLKPAGADLFIGTPLKQTDGVDVKSVPVLSKAEKQNAKHSDSILSARKIQQSLFASDILMKRNLPDSFILDKPSEGVSGDFCWAIEPATGQFYLCLADCKGHGIPGAFRSVLFTGFLNEAVADKKLTSPDAILALVHERIIQRLNPEHAVDRPKEGMDAVLCMFDLKGGWLRFSTANNPVWLIRNGELKEFVSDERTVGRMTAEEKPFKLQTLGLRKGDCIYMFSNGFAKQTNPSGEKFGYKQMQELLISNYTLPMETQQEILNKALLSWEDGTEQVDDILVMGVRV